MGIRTVQGGPAPGSSWLTADSRVWGRLNVSGTLFRPQRPQGSGADAIAGDCGARLGDSHPPAQNDLFLGGHIPKSGICTWGRQEGSAWGRVLLAPCIGRDRQMLGG